MPKFPKIKLKCSKCSHEWISRKDTVVLCPNCKTPLEKNEPIIIIEGKDLLEDYEVEEREL